MKRSLFLTISALVAGAFSLVMLLAPQMFTQGAMAEPPSSVVNNCFQFLGGNLFAFAVLNFMARKSPWSPALRAVLISNIVMHILAMATDWYAFSQHAVTLGGIMQGQVIHIIFVAGFTYYAVKPSPFEKAAAAPSR